MSGPFTVAVIGASDDPQKYSYLAVSLLKEKGHRVFPVHPSLKELLGLSVYPSISQVPGPVHTVSLYVASPVSTKIAPEILAAAPKRILFNPGAENPVFEAAAVARGIIALNACMLVMLKTGNF